MKAHVARSAWWGKFLAAGAMTALIVGIDSTPESAYADGMIIADDDVWISIGLGIRSSFNSIEGAAGGHYSNDFKMDTVRLYINGQMHKYVKFMFNAECFNCNIGGGGSGFGSNSNIGLLDAIGRFEFHEMANLWIGRTLVPSERVEMVGEFYAATFDPFRTPFFPQDFSSNFPSGPNGAPGGENGAYGRSNGAVFFGKIHPFGTHLLYVASVFTGTRGGPNQTGSLMYAGRLQWNLLNDEINPGYYVSGTYYGTAGDILAISGNVLHQKDGAGNPVANAISDFTGISVELLVEKPMPNDMGVFTFSGEFKRFFANYGIQAFEPGNGAFGNCFCIFNGHSWSVLGLYLIPNEIGIGRFQPYVRFIEINPRYANERNEWEAGVNYIISGHNARISAYYRYGDFNGNAGLYTYIAPEQVVQKVDSFHLALQLQY